MIASRLGLGIAIGFAALLALVLALTQSPQHEPADPALVPGFDPATVSELRWPSIVTSAGPRPDGLGPIRSIQITRDPKSPTGWAITEPYVPAESRVVEDVIAAIRGARWHRRGAVALAGRPSQTLEVRAKSPLAIQIGAPLGDEQQWLVIGNRALLVDAWVARALNPDPLSLRVRRPLADAASAKSIRIESASGATIAIAGSRLGEPIALALAPPILALLHVTLSELEIAALPTTQPGPQGTTIRVDQVVITERGACAGGRIQIEGTYGRGCVESATWEQLQSVVAALRGPPDALADRRPVGFTATSIKLVDGTTLDLEKRPRIGDRDADPDRVAELVAALSGEGTVVPLPKAKPLASLVVRAGTREQPLDLYAPNVVVRRGEPVALALEPVLYALLTRPAYVYRDPLLWSEEATTIRSITVDATTYTRGVSLGEWTRTGAGRADAAKLDQLAAALATPRALATAPARPARHKLAIEVAPPVGAPRRHELGLVGPAPKGCLAVTGTESVVLPREICELAAALR
jgi:hypothetical protein